MEYGKFLKLILTHQKIMKDFSELDDLGFNFYDGKYRLVELVDSLFDTVITIEYNKEGVDWINWFIYENEYGHKDWNKNNKSEEAIVYGATDSAGKPIAYSFESLYELLENEYKISSDK